MDIGPDEVQRGVQRLKTLLGATNRDLTDIEIAVFPGRVSCNLDLIKQYRDAGATQVLASAYGVTSQDIRVGIERLAEKVLSHAHEL